jgi:hypothetical protein
MIMRNPTDSEAAAYSAKDPECRPHGRPVHTSMCSANAGEPDARARLASRDLGRSALDSVAAASLRNRASLAGQPTLAVLAFGACVSPL